MTKVSLKKFVAAGLTSKPDLKKKQVKENVDLSWMLYSEDFAKWLYGVWEDKGDNVGYAWELLNSGDKKRWNTLQDKLSNAIYDYANDKINEELAGEDW